MLDRRACERRVYRLAALLSGNPVSAVEVIQAVLDAQPNLREMNSARMDRLTVLRSREITPAQIVDDRVPVRAAKALASLKPQQREAWVFVRMYHIPMREAARAMDCSVTAVTTHMTQANEHMDQALAAPADTPALTQDDAAAALRQWTMAIDVPRFFRLEQARKQRTRLAMLIVAIVLLAGAVVGILALL